jgi:hypothetical protein
LVRPPEGKLDLTASRLNGDLHNADGSKSHANLTATSEHSQLRKRKWFPRNINAFHAWHQ